MALTSRPVKEELHIGQTGHSQPQEIPSDGNLAFFTTWFPADTDITTLVEVDGQRWTIEDSFETANNELRFDHSETRACHGWHRHVLLVTLAIAMTASMRHHAKNATPPKTSRRGGRPAEP